MPLAIFSAILLILAFPSFSLNYLAFIGFVPLFFAVQNKPPKKAFLISYVCGFLFYLGVLYWLYHVTVIGLIVLCLYLALYFGILGLIFSLRAIRYLLYVVPIAWVFLEYIQSHLFSGFGWALMGYSQYKNLPLIQIADLSKVYGVSFFVMMVNVIAWKIVKSIVEYRKKTLFSIFGHLLFMVLIFTLVYAYGFFRLSEKETKTSRIKVSVVQGNISQEEKWDIDNRDAILNKYIRLTREAAGDAPDLIIWPETAFPGFLFADEGLTGDVIRLTKDTKIPLLLGANTEKGVESFNSAVLFSPENNTVTQYDKTHLVPFGEYVPFSEKVYFLHNLVLGELGEFTRGRELKIFTLHPSSLIRECKFGTLICFEDIFPELSMKFVQKGAEFLVVITNDAWYGRSGAPYQHAACSVFRAVENRVPVVRCANTGYSCFIDSYGRIYDSVKENNSHLFIAGYKTSNVSIKIKP
ncbi:MAG: apolipoprotein N-acyltransferase [Candidatus Omnitrophota bacterium]